ncbi:MAG TPA: ATP-binding protein [Candidatus Acidoferrum sp.]|nr:ATP-binding protein [Candidatus Acidoferrum sp.]
MSVPTEAQSKVRAAVISAKPKPYSIERRFRLMQAGTLFLAILLVSTALYVRDAYQSRLATSLQTLHVSGPEVQRLQALNEQMRESSRQLLIVLIAFALFSFFASIWFRRAHQRHIWQHLDKMRQMVSEVRRGNLNITAEVPESIELSSLVTGFLEMAAELRKTRASLERKVVERTAKLELAQKELLQSAKLASLGQLVSGVAHEINNPLTSILGFSEIVLSQRGGDRSVATPVHTIREEALRLKNVVANLSSFARRAPHRTQGLDLRGVVDRLVALREYHLRADNIELHITKPSNPVWVLADPDQLLQVLLNLLLNSEDAIRGCRDRGDIWVDCRTDGQRAHLTLRDNGPGMSAEIREHIFEPFFTTRPQGQGTGLGLSISHGIIQQHHGRIFAEAPDGEGVTMHIELPMSPPPRQASAAPSDSTSSGSPAASAARHVLVIDDEEGLLEMVGDALESFGYRVTLLSSPKRAEAVLQEEQFDVVICDLKMPGQSGLDIYRLVRTIRPGLAARFLLMTGNLADAEQHGAELAAVPILPKPFTLARLREAVGQMFAKPTPA